MSKVEVQMMGSVVADFQDTFKWHSTAIFFPKMRLRFLCWNVWKGEAV